MCAIMGGRRCVDQAGASKRRTSVAAARRRMKIFETSFTKERFTIVKFTTQREVSERER